MPYNTQGVGYQNTATSKAAAPTKPMTLQAMVLEIIMSAGPIDVERIADFLERPLVSVRPRLTELQNAGLIRANGTNLSQFGKKQSLWEMVPVRPTQMRLI